MKFFWDARGNIFIPDDDSPINGKREWVFEGPQGPMTLQEAQRAGYEVRHHSFFGMVAPVPPGMKSRNQTEREMNERARIQQRMLAQNERAPMISTRAEWDALGMQNQNAAQRYRQMIREDVMHDYFYPPEPIVGGLQAGEAKHMGVPCMMPRAGWRERLRQWRRR